MALADIVEVRQGAVLGASAGAEILAAAAPEEVGESRQWLVVSSQLFRALAFRVIKKKSKLREAHQPRRTDN